MFERISFICEQCFDCLDQEILCYFRRCVIVPPHPTLYNSENLDCRKSLSMVGKGNMSRFSNTRHPTLGEFAEEKLAAVNHRESHATSLSHHDKLKHWQIKTIYVLKSAQNIKRLDGITVWVYPTPHDFPWNLSTQIYKLSWKTWAKAVFQPLHGSDLMLQRWDSCLFLRWM